MRYKTKIFILIVSGFVFSNCGNEGAITFLDYPNKIETKIDTIEVSYISWACACPNWIEVDYFEKNPTYKNTDYSKDCFFIEAKKGTIKLPEKHHTTYNEVKIKLIGSFYAENGISRDYIKPTSQKPEHSRVFRYSDFEIIKSTIEILKKETNISEKGTSLIDFQNIINQIKEKTMPVIDTTNFDNINAQIKNYNTKQIENLQLDEIYSNIENVVFKFIPSYKLNISKEFITIIIIVHKGEHELETILINYDLKGKLIDYKIIAYDEIAESMFQKISQINNTKLIITDKVWTNKEQITITEFEISEIGKIKAVANNL